MKKKTIALILAVCMLLTITACGSKEVAPSGTGKPVESDASAKEDEANKEVGTADKVEITLATSLYIEENHQITLDALLEAYNKKNPNVTVTIYGADYNNFWNNVTTEIISGQEADIIQITPDTLSSYYSKSS